MTSVNSRNDDNSSNIKLSPSIKNWKDLGKSLQNIGPIIEVGTSEQKRFWNETPKITSLVSKPNDINENNIILNRKNSNSNSKIKYNNHKNNLSNFSFTDLKQLKSIIEDGCNNKPSTTSESKYDGIVNALNEITQFFENDFIKFKRNDNETSINSILSEQTCNNIIKNSNNNNSSNNNNCNHYYNKTVSLIDNRQHSMINMRKAKAKSEDIYKMNHSKHLNSIEQSQEITKFSTETSFDTTDDIEYIQTYDGKALTKLSELKLQINDRSPTTPGSENIITRNDSQSKSTSKGSKSAESNSSQSPSPSLSNNITPNKNVKINITNIDNKIKMKIHNDYKFCDQKICKFILFSIAIFISFMLGYITQLSINLNKC